MSNQVDSMLIKTKTGQFKTVGLDVSGTGKKQPVSFVSLKPQPPASDAKVVDKEEKEIKQPKIKQVEDKKIHEHIEDKPKKEVVPGLIPAETAMPSFYFHLEDEQEAARFRNKDQVLKHQKDEKILEYLIEKIIQQSSLSLSENVTRRLKRVIDSRLRDVRDLLETKDVLVRSEELGGVGLNNDESKGILKIIESYRLKIQEGLEKLESEVIREKPAMQAGPEAEDKEMVVEKPAEQEKPKLEAFSAEVKEKLDQSLPPSTRGQDEQAARLPRPNVGVRQADKQEKDKEDILHKGKPPLSYVHPSYKEEAPDKSPQAWPKSKIPGRVMTTSQEVVMPADKKDFFQGVVRQTVPLQKTKSAYQRSKLMGPVEELASFDMDNFRKLGAHPKEMTEKIKHKIDLLQDESFVKRAEGIQAWRSSPVYQNYLILGRQSMEGNKSIDETIKDKQTKNEPTLTFEEFQAVADLSQRLNY